MADFDFVENSIRIRMKERASILKMGIRGLRLVSSENRKLPTQEYSKSISRRNFRFAAENNRKNRMSYFQDRRQLPGWRNGRRKGLKILRPQGHASSTLALGTITKTDIIKMSGFVIAVQRRESNAGTQFFSRKIGRGGAQRSHEQGLSPRKRGANIRRAVRKSAARRK